MLSAILIRLGKRHSRKGLYEFLRRQAAGLDIGALVLSVGSGGDVNALLERYSFELIQLDIDPQRGPDIVGDICSANLGSDRFDAVVMSEVLEHVHSPHIALANIHKALKPGGKLILTSPFMLPIHEAPEDYYRYTRYGLAFLLRHYRSVAIQERNGYVESIGVMWLRLQQAGSPFAYVIAPLVLLTWPVTMLLSSLIKSNASTTGYVASAIK